MSEATERILDGLPGRWRIVPLLGKRPVCGADWPTKAARADSVGDLPPRADGWGLLLGPASGVIDIEGDGPEAEAAYARLVGDEGPVCPCWESARGKHRLFAWDDRLAGRSASIKLGDGLEARIGQNLVQSVLPPSGGRRWLVRPDEAEPPPLPNNLADAILAAGQRLDEPGQRLDEAGDQREADCLAACRALDLQDQNDGSRRLFAYCCRAVEYGLPDEAAVSMIRTIERERPFPRTWSDAEIVTRLRQAERHVTRGSVVEGQRIAAGLMAGADETAGPALTCLAEVEPRPVAWLWPNRIPLGRLTVLAGRQGAGKSFVSLDLAARVTTGDSWPDGAPSIGPADVLILAAEDDPADTIRPRLDAAGADVSRVHLLEGRHVRGLDGRPGVVPVTMADIATIGDALERLPACRLVVIDPVGAHTPAKVDAHRDNELRAILGPLARLAAEYAVAMLLVAHVRKSGGLAADDTVLGSIGLVAAARSVYHVMRDPDDDNQRLFLPGKCNLAPEQPGLAFAVAGDPPSVHWLGSVEVRADEVVARLAGGGQRGPEASAEREAEAWLKATLADGPRAAKELLADWREATGHDRRTLDRARQAVGVEAFRPKNPGPWWWRLPESFAKGGCEKQIAKFPLEKKLGNLGNVLQTPVFSGQKQIANGGRLPDCQVSILRKNLAMCPPEPDPKPEPVNLIPPDGWEIVDAVNRAFDEAAWATETTCAVQVV